DGSVDIRWSPLCEWNPDLSWESTENNSARSQGWNLIRGYHDLRLGPVDSRAWITKHIHSRSDRLDPPTNRALPDRHHVVGVRVLLLTGLFSFSQSDRILVQSRTRHYVFLIPRLLSHTDQRRLGHVDRHRWTLSWKSLLSVLCLGGSKGSRRKEAHVINRERAMVSTLNMQVLQCIDVGMDSLGGTSKHIVYWYLAQKRNLTRDGILDDPNAFIEALRTLFGQGAGILERTIIRQLRQTFNVTFGENLTEVLALVRRKDSSTAADTHLRTGSAKTSLED